MNICGADALFQSGFRKYERLEEGVSPAQPSLSPGHSTYAKSLITGAKTTESFPGRTGKGKITMKRINYRKTAFTLIELLVVIAIIALLAAILFPVFARARENARRTSCLSNLKQIGLSVIQYSQDYDERLPLYHKSGSYTWPDLLAPYIVAASGTIVNSSGNQVGQQKPIPTLICPSAQDGDIWKSNDGALSTSLNQMRSSYAVNRVYNDYRYGLFVSQNGVDPSPAPLAAIEDAVGTIFAGDSTLAVKTGSNTNNHFVAGDTIWPTTPPTMGSGSSATSQSVGQFHARHFDGCNFVFLDGHAKWLKLESLAAQTSGGRITAFTRQLD